MVKTKKPSKSSKNQQVYRSPIADPIADEKLSRRLVRLAGALAEDKLTRRGVKEVVKCIRRG